MWFIEMFVSKSVFLFLCEYMQQNTMQYMYIDYPVSKCLARSNKKDKSLQVTWNYQYTL
jgi:hypothetical protein